MTGATAPNRVDAALSALADPYRRQAIELLSARPHRAGELADALGLTPPAMSRHLRTLRQSGLVEERHDGFDARVRIYQLRQGPMADLASWLKQTEAMWAEQLVAFRDHMAALDQEAP